MRWTFNKKFIAVFRWSIIMFPNHNRKRTGKKQERSNNGLMKISKIKGTFDSFLFLIALHSASLLYFDKSRSKKSNHSRIGFTWRIEKGPLNLLQKQSLPRKNSYLPLCLDEISKFMYWRQNEGKMIVRIPYIWWFPKWLRSLWFLSGSWQTTLEIWVLTFAF